MKSIKDKIIGGIIKVEGGYVNNPHDRGGETKYGITKSVAEQHGYTGEMRKLSYSFAYDVYSKSYWDVNMLDDVAHLSERIAEEVADTGVNMGPGTAAKFLQRALNALNRQEKLYDDLLLDGQVGLKTLAALRDLFDVRDKKDAEKVLFILLNSFQTCRYVEIVEKNPTQEEFLFGWVLHRGQ